MKPLGHAVISLAAGSVLYNYSRSLAVLAWFLVASIFIDIDHYIDYVRERGIDLDLRRVYYSFKYGHMEFKKTMIILHSYELLIVLWLTVFLFDFNIVLRYAAIGLTLHIFIDQLSNPSLSFAYFFWFRAMNKFETKKIFTYRRV